MKVVYYADDGTQFNTKSECASYEQRIKQEREGMVKYIYCEDIEHKQIDIFKNPEAVDTAHYVYILNPKGLDLARKLYKEYGVLMPYDLGSWRWNHDLDRFEPFDEILDMLAFQLKEGYGFMERAKRYFIEKEQEVINNDSSNSNN